MQRKKLTWNKSRSTKRLLIAYCLVVVGAIGNARETSADLGTIELVSIEHTHALNNPDMPSSLVSLSPKPSNSSEPESGLVKINFRSSIDLLRFAYMQNERVRHEVFICDRQGHYPIYLESSELYQLGIDFASQTEGLLFRKSSFPRARGVADEIFMTNKKRMQVLYFYIRVRSINAPSGYSYNMKNLSEDICLRLEASHLKFDRGFPMWVDPIYSNAIQISKEAITRALKAD